MIDMFKNFFKRLKCNHKFFPQYQLMMVGGMDKVYVSKCKCGKHQYKSLKRVMKEGAAKKK